MILPCHRPTSSNALIVKPSSNWRGSASLCAFASCMSRVTCRLKPHLEDMTLCHVPIMDDDCTVDDRLSVDGQSSVASGSKVMLMMIVVI